MKRLLLFALSLICLSCSENKETDFDPLKSIPQDSELILHIPDLLGFSETLENNNFIAANELHLKNSIEKNLGYLKHLNIKDESIIAFTNLNQDSLEYVLITKRDSGLVKIDSVQNKSHETLKLNDLQFQKFQLETSVFYQWEKGQTSIFSNSVNRLEAVARAKSNAIDQEFKKVYQATALDKPSLFIKHSAKNGLAEIMRKSGFPSFVKFANWSALDLEITNSEIRANGLSLGNSSLLTAFEHVDPKPIESFKICPDAFISFYGLGYSSFEKLNKGLKEFKQDSPDSSYAEVLNHTREIANISLKEGSFFALNAVEIETARESMAGWGEISETYRDTEIFRLGRQPGIIKALQTLMVLEKPEFYTILDHFILFSASQETLKTTIQAYQNSNILAEKSYFQELNSKLSSESSLLFLSRLPETGFLLPENKRLKGNKNSLAAFQWIVDDNFAHLHSIISNSEQSEFQNNGVEQSRSIKLPKPAITRPYFLRNHRTDQMDMVVQDSENNVHLISNKGNRYWSKKMDSKIMGDVHEVDLFRNGNKQLAFSTGYNMEVLDRDGNKVDGFRIRFNQPLTQPLAVFDYDNNRKYRFVLTQNSRVYMVGPNGKAIRGFDFEAAKTEVILPPKHIRLGTKDYILIAEASGKLNILSRQGKIRVPVSEPFKFSGNHWYGHKEQFVSTAKTSNLIRISQNGKVSRQDLGLAENNRIVANDDHLVYLNENQLSINGKIIEMDFGLYTDPQLFQFRKRGLVAITDTQAQKVYVFKTDGELLEGFPVYGTSQVDIANADLDGKLELLVLGEENEILVYEF